MGKWFWDFSFWIQGYRTAQTAHCALDTVQEEKYLWVLISEDASSLPESPWSLTLTCRGGTVDPFVFVIITIVITDVTNIAFEGSV